MVISFLKKNRDTPEITKQNFSLAIDFSSVFQLSKNISADIFLFKVNNSNTKERCEICLKLTIKKPERHH